MARQPASTPLALRIPFWHPDKFFEHMRPLSKWLFGLPGAVLWLLVVPPSVAAGGTALARGSAPTPPTPRVLAGHNIVPLAMSYLVLKAMHEFWAWICVKAFGGAVHEFGVNDPGVSCRCPMSTASAAFRIP